MAQVHCNLFSYSLGYPVDIEVILPSFTSCNMQLPHTHALPGKFPVLFLHPLYEISAISRYL